MVGLGCKISIPKPKQHVAVVVRALFIAEAEEAKIFFCKEVSFNDPFLVVIWFYCRYFLEREHKRRDHGVIGGAMTSASTVLRQRYCGHQSVKTKEGTNGTSLTSASCCCLFSIASVCSSTPGSRVRPRICLTLRTEDCSSVLVLTIKPCRAARRKAKRPQTQRRAETKKLIGPKKMNSM